MKTGWVHKNEGAECRIRWAGGNAMCIVCDVMCDVSMSARCVVSARVGGERFVCVRVRTSNARAWYRRRVRERGHREGGKMGGYGAYNLKNGHAT